MTTSPNLSLAYLASSQAQKEVTHNDALNDLDALAQICVTSRTLTTPPASPVEGDCYIVGAAATGAWVGHDLAIASYYAGWRFKTPKAGWLAFVRGETKFYVFSGSSWAALGGFV